MKVNNLNIHDKYFRHNVPLNSCPTASHYETFIILMPNARSPHSERRESAGIYETASQTDTQVLHYSGLYKPGGGSCTRCST